MGTTGLAILSLTVLFLLVSSSTVRKFTGGEHSGTVAVRLVPGTDPDAFAESIGLTNLG